MAVNPYDGAGYGCGIGYGYCGTPASGALDILASVGTSTSKTSAQVTADGDGLKDIAVPFSSKAFLPFSALMASSTGASNATIGLGGFTSSSQFAVAAQSQDGVTTSNTDRRHTASSVVSVLNNSGSEIIGASKESIQSDGVTLNWTNAAASAYILNHIALGGADLEVSLTLHQMNNTGADESFAHGLSGAPTGVLFFSAVYNAAPPSTTTVLHSSIGMYSSSGQYCGSIYSGNGATTTLTRRVLLNSGVVSYTDNAIRKVLTVDTTDSTNVNCSYTVTGTTYQTRFFMLAIRGAKVQTGTFDCNGSTDPLSISCAGITPVAMRLVNIPTGVDSINTLQNNAHLGIGWSDGTNNVSCGITDENGRISGTNARRFQDSDDIAQYDVAGTEKFRARVTFSGENAIITPAVCNDGWDQGAYIIIGK